MGHSAGPPLHHGFILHKSRVNRVESRGESPEQRTELIAEDRAEGRGGRAKSRGDRAPGMLL